MNFFDESFLFDILSQPTAPFREKFVISRIVQQFDQFSVPYFMDPIGNIVVGVKSKAEYLKAIKTKSQEPLRFFIAHMDHPGFHATRWITDNELELKWHGGSATEYLEQARVWLADSRGYIGSGRMKSVTLVPSKKGIDTGVVRVESSLDRKIKSVKGVFGGFQFRAPFWKEGDLIYTQAADDLVGAFAISQMAIHEFIKNKKRRGPIPFIGLLTRAEEVGFIGAIGHFELGWLKQATRPVLCVSLETSRTLPGAEIGKGPIVRLGDRYTVFDPQSLRVLTELAEARLPQKHQRRIMDGGTCEATAATAYGFASVGISIPLGNYHNQCLEGGPDSAPGLLGPAPEFVHLQDINGLLILCFSLLEPKLPWNGVWKQKRSTFKKELARYSPLLRNGL